MAIIVIMVLQYYKFACVKIDINYLIFIMFLIWFLNMNDKLLLYNIYLLKPTSIPIQKSV